IRQGDIPLGTVGDHRLQLVHVLDGQPDHEVRGQLLAGLHIGQITLPDVHVATQLLRDGEPVVEEQGHPQAVAHLLDLHGAFPEGLLIGVLVAQLHHGDTTVNGLLDDAGDPLGATSEVRVGHEVEAEIGHRFSSRRWVRFSSWLRSSWWSASRSATEKEPGAVARVAAMWPAAPRWACAAITASWGLMSVSRVAPR